MLHINTIFTTVPQIQCQVDVRVCESQSELEELRFEYIVIWIVRQYSDRTRRWTINGYTTITFYSHKTAIYQSQPWTYMLHNDGHGPVRRQVRSVWKVYSSILKNSKCDQASSPSVSSLKGYPHNTEPTYTWGGCNEVITPGGKEPWQGQGPGPEQGLTTDPSRVLLQV